jgi:hypothetical protein
MSSLSSTNDRDENRDDFFSKIYIFIEASKAYTSVGASHMNFLRNEVFKPENECKIEFKDTFIKRNFSLFKVFRARFWLQRTQKGLSKQNNAELHAISNPLKKVRRHRCTVCRTGSSLYCM